MSKSEMDAAGANLEVVHSRSPYSSAGHARQPSTYWTPESVAPSNDMKSSNGISPLPAASEGYSDALSNGTDHVSGSPSTSSASISPSTTTIRPSSISPASPPARGDFIQAVLVMHTKQDPSPLDPNPFGGQLSVGIGGQHSIDIKESAIGPSSSLSPTSSIPQSRSTADSKNRSRNCWIEAGILLLVALAAISIVCSTILAAVALGEFDQCGELADNAPFTLQTWLLIHAIGTGLIMLGLILLIFGPRSSTAATLLIIWFILSEAAALVWQIFGGIIFRISGARDLCSGTIVDKCMAIFALTSLHVLCCMILPAAIRQSESASVRATG